LEGFCSTIELHPLGDREMGQKPFVCNPRSLAEAPLDPAQAPTLPIDSHDAPERHRCKLGCSPLVARLDLYGAMARLID
jgi:hypothetical protein